MSNNNLISIIVPVYNVEQYLRRCLESIVSQTYTNLEIILVDDGSQDSSGVICDEYAEKDTRIHVIHQKNAGQSIARNNGLCIATGNYIGFVDSDDYITLEMYSRMFDVAISTNADIVNCGILQIIGESTIETRFAQYPISESNAEAGIRLLLKAEIPVVPWNKLYNKKLFDNVKFPEEMFYEDEYIMPYLFTKAKKIAYLNNPFYIYNIRHGSTIRSTFGKADIDRLKALENHIKVFLPKFPDIEITLKQNYYNACVDVFTKAMQSKAPLDQRRKIFKCLLYYIKDIYPKLKGGNKLEALIAQCGFAIYSFYRTIRMHVSTFVN